MDRVFAVQQQHYWDKSRGEFLPKFDLSPAESFGRIEYLLSPTAAPFRPDGIVEELHERLSSIKPGDYLLLIGNPVLIGLACAIAADYLDGRLQLLQWSGKERRYIPVIVEGVFGDVPGEPNE